MYGKETTKRSFIQTYKQKTGKIMLMMILVAIIAVLMGGCSHVYKQYAVNEIGERVSEAYIRNTGSEIWSSWRISEPRLDTILTILETNEIYSPPQTQYKDILLVDTNGVWYAKMNVPVPDGEHNYIAPGVRHYPRIKFTTNDRIPTLRLVNQTGYPIVISGNIPQRTLDIRQGGWGSIGNFNPNESIRVNYSINDYTFSRNVDMSNGDTSITLTERPPLLTVINSTGYPVNISSPFSHRLLRNEQIVYPKQSRTVTPLHTIVYSISTEQYSEQVTINEDDVTLSLTRRPAIVTIQNNSGATMINVQIRPSGLTGVWDSVNLLSIQLNEDGTAVRRDVGGVSMFVTDLTGSIVTRDNFRFWMGNLELSDGIYDIRVDDVHGMAYLKRNVQISSDIEISFTASDKL
ncbi:MAG: hypothetical protein FWG98_14840 [Candidatus Cloacimonetes bacterium]|nr:hypothetical protein [Candidatus Cloacimonadota bacterium]